MARACDIENDNSKRDLLNGLRKAVQSANLNFLIGSGCSHPAIPPLGNIELKVQEKINDGKLDEAEKLIFVFLRPFLEVSVKMKNDPDAATKETLDNYRAFLANVSQILFKRKSNILQKQATIFSTNYDLFVEKAFEETNTPVKLNDGFNRGPLLSGCFPFSSSEFSNSTYNVGNLYNYQVQIPSINLIKLHGSLSWQSTDNQITFSVSGLDALLTEYQTLSTKHPIDGCANFNRKFSIVLPREDKFKDTLLNQTYYDLFRLYANELDKENTLLIAEGVSFSDQHILQVTHRALKNPTLQVIIFCHEKKELASYKQKFPSFNNVNIVYSESCKIDFALFNSIMREVLPSAY